MFATTQDLNVREQNKGIRNDNTLHWSFSQCETLREVLGIDAPDAQCAPSSAAEADTPTVGGKTIDWLIISNYMIDFHYLLDEVPELVSIPRVVVFYGCAETEPPPIWKQNNAVDLRRLDPTEAPRTVVNPTSQRIPYGVHHSKFFLIGYNDETMRVVIHTANLRNSDLHLKAQALYRQDFPFKTLDSSSESSQSSSANTSPFEETLLDYLDTYKFQEPRIWRPGESRQFLRQVIKRYDFSAAGVVLIPSTPGYHRLDEKESRGHLKVRETLNNQQATVSNKKTRHASVRSEVSGQTSASDQGPIICQFSSMGSLTEKYLREEFQTSFNASKSRTSSNLVLKIVYPTVQEIRESVEGYRGGASVPGPARNVQKPFLRPLFHRWTTPPICSVNPIHKGNNVPHIKTYYQLKPRGDEMAMEYFIVTSHNLSKAAWGEIQNSARHGGRRLFVRHWELGVLMTPDLVGCARLVPWDEQPRTGDFAIPVPFRLDPTPYDPSDQPWAVDIPNKIKDRFGRYSCLS